MESDHKTILIWSLYLLFHVLPRLAANLDWRSPLPPVSGLTTSQLFSQLWLQLNFCHQHSLKKHETGHEWLSNPGSILSLICRPLRLTVVPADSCSSWQKMSDSFLLTGWHRWLGWARWSCMLEGSYRPEFEIMTDRQTERPSWVGSWGGSASEK